MSLNKNTGLWKCFGRCDTTFGGDSLDLACMASINFDYNLWKSLNSEKKEQNKALYHK